MANPPRSTYPLSKLMPGTFGVSYGAGALAWAIHRAERAMTRSDRFPAGDAQASWAGHAFMFIGDHDFGIRHGGVKPAIVQAEWPRVVISPATAHPDAVWAVGQPLTDAQRELGRLKALSLVNEHYDLLVYPWYLAKVIDAGLSQDLTALFTDSRWGQVICSGLDVQCEVAMGVDVRGLSTAATTDPDFTCPADLFRWGIDRGWMNWVPHPAARRDGR